MKRILRALRNPVSGMVLVIALALAVTLGFAVAGLFAASECSVSINGHTFTLASSQHATYPGGAQMLCVNGTVYFEWRDHG